MKNDVKLKAALLSITSNISLIVLKLTTGVLISSISVISEGIHSGLDLIAAIITYASLKKSSQPPDDTHRFGHGKVEDISGAVEAILIFGAAFFIIYISIEKLLKGGEIEMTTPGIAIMAISAILNFFVSKKLLKVARETDSIALEADGWHLRTDVYTSTGVLGGLLLIAITGLKILDPVFAIIVALFIIKAGFELTKRSIYDLTDYKLPDEDELKIKSILEEHTSQFVEFHKLRTRRSGSDKFVDLHLVVSKNLTLDEAHNLCYHLEDDLKKAFPTMNVMIHIEPCGQNCISCRIECRAKEST
ncbi:MAG: cation diffusion facilitator family transporter [Methanocellales archaeon]